MLPPLLLPLFCAVAAQEPAAEPRGWDDFPVLVWRQRYRGNELPPELVEPFGGVNVERDDEAGWVRERGLSFYVGHGPGRDDLHLDADEEWQERFQRWYDSRDEKLLVRDPCLTDPGTIRRMEETLDRTLAARGGDHGLGISLGDEVGLTPYGNPFDLCRSETCEARWREYAKEHGWPADAPTTDEARLALGEDDFSLLGPWLARRRLHQDVVLDVLQRLAKHVREKSPGTPVGLLGLGGQTAFGGVSVPRAAEFLDFLECYPVSESVELLHTTSKTRSLGTVFLNEDTAEGTAWQVWNHWMQGADGIVVWSDQELEDLPEHRRRLTEALAAIRSVEKRFPDASKPRPETFGIVHDADSIAASWLKDALLDGMTWPRRLAGYQEENGTRETQVDAWLRVLRDNGYEPGAVPLAALDAEATKRYPVLILPRVLVVGDDDLERLEAHLEKGGVLILDGEFGWVDRRGRPREGDMPRTFAPYEERVVTKLSPWLSREAGSRYKPKFEVDFYLQAMLTQLGIDQRVESQGGMELPCFRVRREMPDGSILVAMLPGTFTPAEREEHLRGSEVLIGHDDDHRLEWIHPAGATSQERHWSAELRAGDAAVFLLTPK